MIFVDTEVKLKKIILGVSAETVVPVNTEVEMIVTVPTDQADRFRVV